MPKRVDIYVHFSEASDEVRQIIDNVSWEDNLSLMMSKLLEAGIGEILQKFEKQESYDDISKEIASSEGRNVTSGKTMNLLFPIS